MASASFGRELVAWMTGNYKVDRRIAASSSSSSGVDGVVGVVDDFAVHHNRIHSPDHRMETASSESPAA